MADLSKDDLKKEITAILKDANLATTSVKKVRQQLEDKLDCDLASRKKEIDEIVMACLEKGKKTKKNGTNEDDDDEEEEEEEEEEPEKEEEEEEEEEEDEDEEEKKPKRGTAAKKRPLKKKGSSDESEEGSGDKESDEEYSPNKKRGGGGKAKAKPAAKGRKKKGSDSDSDEDWGKGSKGSAPKKAKRGGGGGYTKACNLSPELAALVGAPQMARHDVVKKVWQIIKEKNLYDPKNKQYAVCNDDLMKVIGVKRFRTFGMMKHLKKHFVD